MFDLDKNALDRYITGNWGEDQFRDGQDDWEEEEEYTPEEEDGFIWSDHHGTHASFSGKHLGTFEDEDEAENVVKATGNRDKYWPNVWRVSDHGNHHLIEDFWS